MKVGHFSIDKMSAKEYNGIKGYMSGLQRSSSWDSICGWNEKVSAYIIKGKGHLHYEQDL